MVKAGLREAIGQHLIELRMKCRTLGVSGPVRARVRVHQGPAPAAPAWSELRQAKHAVLSTEGLSTGPRTEEGRARIAEA